jgi:hypothetical protein
MATGMRANEREKKEVEFGRSICTKIKCQHKTKYGCGKMTRKYFTASERASIVDGFCIAE